MITPKRYEGIRNETTQLCLKVRRSFHPDSIYVDIPLWLSPVSQPGSNDVAPKSRSRNRTPFRGASECYVNHRYSRRPKDVLPSLESIPFFIKIEEGIQGTKH